MDIVIVPVVEGMAIFYGIYLFKHFTKTEKGGECMQVKAVTGTHLHMHNYPR